MTELVGHGVPVACLGVSVTRYTYTRRQTGGPVDWWPPVAGPGGSAAAQRTAQQRAAASHTARRTLAARCPRHLVQLTRPPPSRS